MDHPEKREGCIKAHLFLHSKTSLGSLKAIFKFSQGNIVMFVTENVFIGLETISMFYFFSQDCLFILPFYFVGLEGEGSVNKLISLDNPFLLEHN